MLLVRTKPAIVLISTDGGRLPQTDKKWLGLLVLGVISGKAWFITVYNTEH